MPCDNSKKRLAGQLPHEEAAPITPLGEVVARDRADLDLGAGQESALAGRDRPPGVPSASAVHYVGHTEPGQGLFRVSAGDLAALRGQIPSTNGTW